MRPDPRQGTDCISCSSAGSQMPLYRTPTSEIHPQKWRLHLRRLATGHPALPLSQKPLSVKLASFGFSLGNFRWIVHISTGCLGADGAEETALCAITLNANCSIQGEKKEKVKQICIKYLFQSFSRMLVSQQQTKYWIINHK